MERRREMRQRKVLATILTFVMVLSTFLGLMEPITARAAEKEVIAGWEFSAAPASLPVQSAEGSNAGTLNTKATGTIGYSVGSLSATAWSVGAYWELKVDTTEYENITFSAKTRSSNTGPAKWHLEYSVDGENWEVIEGSNTAIINSLDLNYDDFKLPDAVADQENLGLRIVVSEDVTVRGTDGTIPSSGVSNINSIYFKGEPIGGDSGTVAPVTASPGSGKIEVGTSITLSTTTDGASIHYNFDNGTIWKPYSEAIEVTELPLTIYAYASKDDVNSETAIFEYIAKADTTIPDPIDDDAIPSGVFTIKDVLDGTVTGTATVIGQVAYGFGNATTKNSYILQDVIAGQVYALQVFDYNNSYTTGNIVTVTGTIGLYGKVTQISPVSSFEVQDLSADKFPPQEVTISELLSSGDEYLSNYIVLRGVILGTQGTNGSTSVSDGTGKTLPIYTGALYPDGATAGTVVDLYAVYSKYNDTYQLRVGSSSDYVMEGADQFDTSVAYALAQWAASMAPTSVIVNGDLYDANDYLDTEAELTLSTGAIPQASGNYLGSVHLTEGEYYQLKLSSELLGNLQLNYEMYGSGTGPRDFIILYSTDGTNFTQANDTTYQITTAAVYQSFSINLPAEANDAENLYIRIQVASNTSISGNASIGSGGTNRLRAISITGNPKTGDDIVSIPKVTPESGAILANQSLTMTSDTQGAEISYSFDDGDTWATYDSSNKPALTAEQLPARLTVKAEKSDLKGSLTATYEYTQTQVAAVKASPNGGAVALDSKVTLSCATAGATIKYSKDNTNWETYSSSEKITLSELPTTIYAKAEADGYKDSEITTLRFTQRENEDYNIFFGQLHSHTSYSDGAGTIFEAYEHAKGVDTIDFLAVTDHSNSFDNAGSASLANGSVSTEWTEGHAAAEAATDNDFVALFGYEMTWSNGLGHVNTFNTQGFQSRTQSDYSVYSTALQNYYTTLKTDTSSLTQFNHPGTTFGDFSDFSYYDADIDDLITLIEVGNGEGAIGSSGYFPSYEYYTRALDKGWHVAPSNNQDNHKGNWGDSNTARTVVLADSLSEENIYDAIRNMRVYSTEDNDLEINYSLDAM